MGSISMNDFKIIKDDKGNYCLESIANEIHYEYKLLFQKYQKKSITEKELKQLLDDLRDNENVVILKKKISIFKKNKWIKKVDSLLKEENSKLEIDETFVRVWNSLVDVRNIRISTELLECLNFVVENKENNDGSPRKRFKKDRMLEFIDFLKVNNIDFKSSPTSKSKKLIITLKFINFANLFKVRSILNVPDGKDYLYELHTIFNSYSSGKQDEENAKLKADNEKLTVDKENMGNIIRNVTAKSKDGYIYVATSEKYALENKFKVGLTENLKKRLSTYNTGRSSDDEFFYCLVEKTYNMRKVESIIDDLLGDFKDKKDREIYILHHVFLLRFIRDIIKNLGRSYDGFNDFVQKHAAKIYDMRGTVPEKIDISNLEQIENDMVSKSIYKVFDRYIKNNTLNTTRKQLFDDVKNVLGSELKISEMWKTLKKKCNWKSNFVLYKERKINIKY